MLSFALPETACQQSYVPAYGVIPHCPSPNNADCNNPSRSVASSSVRALAGNGVTTPKRFPTSKPFPADHRIIGNSPGQPTTDFDPLTAGILGPREPWALAADERDRAIAAKRSLVHHVGIVAGGQTHVVEVRDTTVA